MTREAMRFIDEQGEEAVVPASELREATLALHGASALSQHVRRRGLPAVEPG